MVALNLLLHDVLVQLREYLGGKDILSEYAVVLLVALFVAHSQKFLGIAGLGFLAHSVHVQDGVIVILPNTVQNAIAAHFGQGDRMDTYHQSVVALVILDHL